METAEVIDDREIGANSLNAFSPRSLHGGVYPGQWRSLVTRPLSRDNLLDLFANRIPDVCHPGLLSESECQRLIGIIKTHEIGAYPIEDIWPPVGSVGIAFNHIEDKQRYFSSISDAQSLQQRFRREAGIDVLGRVCERLCEVSRLPVRIAREEDVEYFAGLLRLVNRAAKLHADYGPIDAPEYEIGRVSAQLTWNILLKDVDGGECIVHNRPWQGDMDKDLRNPAPEYGYIRQIVAGRESKSMKYQVGDLHLFNSRNIHEVNAISDPERQSRFTMSAFVGFLPDDHGQGPSIILWS